MAKDLNVILKRTDYKHLTSQLEERAENIAFRIGRKMKQLDMNGEIIKIKSDDFPVSVRLSSVRSNSCGSYEFLAMDCAMWSDDYDSCSGYWCSLEDVASSYYYSGDFCAWVEGAPRNAALAFLNVAGKIIDRLGEIEENKVKAVTHALAETENL